MVASGALAASSQEVQAPAPGGKGEITVLQTTTRRVSVDVVVTDYNGKPVTGFSRGDFSIFEDGVLQPMRSFDPHTPSTEAPVCSAGDSETSAKHVLEPSYGP